MASDPKVVPLHRVTHPDHHKGWPRYVRPLTGAEIVSLSGDKDAAYNRADLQARGDHVWRELQKLPRQADLGDWLERGRRIGFNPRVPWGEWAVVCVVFGAICAGWWVL